MLSRGLAVTGCMSSAANNQRVVLCDFQTGFKHLIMINALSGMYSNTSGINMHNVLIKLTLNVPKSGYFLNHDVYCTKYCKTHLINQLIYTIAKKFQIFTKQTIFRCSHCELMETARCLNSVIMMHYYANIIYKVKSQRQVFKVTLLMLHTPHDRLHRIPELAGN